MGARLLGLQQGPASIVLVRHGESVGNLADAEARRQDAERLDLTARDADVELSETGQKQAESLGRHVSGLADQERPTLIVSSPYERATSTAGRALEHVGLDIVLDERLRERDLGQLDGLTGRGIRHLHAGEADRRSRVGKFYYQPPGGESWADVVLRVRSLLADLRVGFEGQRVWMFTHQAVIMAFRYVLEGISEADLLEIDRDTAIPNCSLTVYDLDQDGPVLRTFADTAALDGDPVEVTEEPSASEPTGATS